MTADASITQLLQAAATGSREARDALFDSVYQELRHIAKAQRRRWSGNDTLSTTALINEAYLRLAKNDLASYENRTHFFATASRAMRQVLINYAKRVSAVKRGGDALRVTVDEFMAADQATVDELLRINELLEGIEAENPRHCRVVECRVFGGLTVEETAAALAVSTATVKRDWSVLSAWLSREMQPDKASQPPRPAG